EREALRRIERGAIVRACLAGALSGAASGIAEALAKPLPPQQFWPVVLGVTVAAASCELAFIYFHGLRSSHELARAAGLEVKGDPILASALARAALEMPNPTRPVLGVDPRREASRWRLLAGTLAYKAKVSMTNFFAKLLLRRL